MCLIVCATSILFLYTVRFLEQCVYYTYCMVCVHRQ